MKIDHNQELLNEQDVARLLKISVATVRRRRLLRQAPNFIKLGACVRYRAEAVELFIANGEQKIGEGK